MLMELLTGNEYKEIGNRNTIENIHEAYKALLLNGFRFVPKYTMNINTTSIHINGDELENELKNISNSDILQIEQLLSKLKIDECIKKGLIKDKTIIYTHYVDGIVPMLRNKIESLGLKVDCYTGNETEEQRKYIINDFINGNLNVLIGSKPISTGVDGLQKVCNNMIVISAPWTNAEYHQLIKRIYRQGSLFKEVDVVIPKVYIDKWSWDERRIEIIEHKKTLGEAVLDGSFNFKKYDEDSFRTKLLSKALEALKQGIEDKDIIRKKIEIEEVDVVKIQRAVSYVNEIHRIANTSKHENISKNVYENDKNKFNEYHKHRQESIKSWIENPINYVADIINNRNEASYHDIIDMGCGLNQ
jgi:superfamily II DNA or RNA helicase